MEDIKKEMIGFWRKFGTLLKSGVPFLNALDLIKEETPSAAFKDIISDIKKQIRVGKNLSKSIAQYSKYFSQSVQTMIEASELKGEGELDAIMLEIANGLENGTLETSSKRIPDRAKPSDKEEFSGQERPPIDDMLYSVLKGAVEKNASDIHIEWLKDGQMRIRYRIDGVLTNAPVPGTKQLQDILISRIKILAGLDAGQKKLPQDGRIILDWAGEELDLRVSTVPYITGESAVIRVLQKSSGVIGLNRQGFTEQNLAKVRKWAKSPSGVIIVTGPTGCGKTTTLYALLQELNSDAVNIVTAEDPVEYQLNGVNQLQIRPQMGLTFASALRAQLRQSPDVIMVNEIRDLEAAQMIFQAAITGHLVLTTLHTQNATAVISRLLDLGIEPALINNALIGVVAQRLIRINCKDCKEEYKPNNWLDESAKLDKNTRYFKGKGCAKCNQTGYHGRLGIHELMEMEDKLRNMVNKDYNPAALRQQAIESGMVTLREDGLAKVKEGITTIEEVIGCTM